MAKSVKARPAVLRALGLREPPALVTIDGECFERAEVFKHDSWAATARYAGPEFDVVCKFNRVQPICGLPTFPLGRFLALREDFAYRALLAIPGITEACGRVYVEGEWQKNAVAHRFIDGHPLGGAEQVDDDFFPVLLQTLQAVHQAGFAYVDLHKRENILVSEDGKPYLIDFQICFFATPRNWFWPISGRVLKVLQQSDLYHLSKHVKRLRPDQLETLGLGEASQLPWWIKLHRLVAVPFRQTRRRLLTLLGVRGKSGRSSTEVFAEHAFRCDEKRAA